MRATGEGLVRLLVLWGSVHPTAPQQVIDQASERLLKTPNEHPELIRDVPSTFDPI